MYFVVVIASLQRSVNTYGILQNNRVSPPCGTRLLARRLTLLPVLLLTPLCIKRLQGREGKRVQRHIKEASWRSRGHGLRYESGGNWR